MNRRLFLLTSSAAMMAARTAAAADNIFESIQLDPTTLILAPGGQAITKIYNIGHSALQAQAQIKRWTQDVNGDHLTNTNDVVVSPPFATLASQATQTVRVADLSTPPNPDETPYRLIVNQLPSLGALSGTQVQILLSISIPVFVSGNSQLPPALSYSIMKNGGEAFIAIYNDGGTHARLSNLDLTGSGGQSFVRVPGLAGYALPKSMAMVKIPAGVTLPAPSALRLMVQTQTLSKQEAIPLRIG